MKKQPDDLEDLVTYLECAKDNLLVIHSGMEEDCIDRGIIMNATYSIYVQLQWIAEVMRNQLEKVPYDIIRKAGGITPTTEQ